MQHDQFLSFLTLHQLPKHYLEHTSKAYQIVIDDVLSQLKSKTPIVIGINGCQGSGKSTTAAFLQYSFEITHHLKVVNISLDDFYLSKAARIQKSKKVHPLFATRGVPGTHDIALAINTTTQILEGKTPYIPRFNKAIDDLYPKNEWEKAPEKVDIIILEGWCLGAKPQDDIALLTPVNTLETTEDINGVWRKHVNDQLRSDYQALFNLVDCLVMLKAPSFDAVFNWRLEQENKLAKKLLLSNKAETKKPSESSSGLMSAEDIKSFVEYFQRLTENMLIEMPERTDHCYFLNTERQIVHEQHRATNN